MAQGGWPHSQWLLLEDANDLVDFLEATGRTIPRAKWAVESIATVERKSLEALF